MSGRRRWALGSGLGVAALALLPPLAGAVQHLLVAHMFQHMLLLAVSAPLLVYALQPMAARRLDAVARRLGHPVTGLLAFNGVLFIWQFPAAFEAAMRDGALHQLAHLSFLLAALCFWWPIIRPSRAPGGLAPIAKVGYLLLAGVPPTIPSVILALSRAPIYSSYAGTPGSFGLSPLEDQQLAGLLLFGTAKFALLTGTFVILWRLLQPQPDPPGDDRDPQRMPDAPPSTPAWLARLEDELPAEPAPDRRVPALQA